MTTDTRVVTVALPEFLRCLTGRVEELIYHCARPFELVRRSDPDRSQMLFEEAPGRWLRTVNSEIKSSAKTTSIHLVDVQAAYGFLAFHMDKVLAENPHEWAGLEHLFKTHMPYAYMRLKDGSKVAVNRTYAPLAAPHNRWADYENYAAHAENFSREPQAMEGVWSHVDDDGARSYLYDDDPASRRNYFTRLLKLDDQAELPGEIAPPHAI